MSALRAATALLLAAGILAGATFSTAAAPSTAAASADAGAPPAVRPPAEAYVLHCSGCHGLDGRGVPGATPSLHDLARLIARPGGREYVARVPGVAQAPASDAELAELLNWVVAKFSEDALAERYTPAEIGALRRSPLRDTVAARAALSP
jgi:mono/diheme cytochrome c family protein